jgi:nicotinamidase-related amidase
MPTPRRPVALLIIECQRGVVGDLSFIPALAEAAAPVLPNIGRLAKGAREAGVLVVHLTFAQQAGLLTTNQRSRMMKAAARNTTTWSGERPGYEIVPEIGVDPSDLVLPRHQGLSPVHRTETLTMLRNLGIDEVVLAGVSTNLAIPLVAGAATDEDFAVTIPADATAGTPREHHESMLQHTLPVLGRIVTVDELLKEWA